MMTWLKKTYIKGKEKTLAIVNGVQHSKDKLALQYNISTILKGVELWDEKPGDIRYIDIHSDLCTVIDAYLVRYPEDKEEMYGLRSVKDLYALAYPPPISKKFWKFFGIMSLTIMSLVTIGAISALIRLGYVGMCHILHIK